MSPQLKHEVIAEVLEREIRGGQFANGNQLPGETALAERFAVSRTTVRAALSELGRAGLISTRSGKGSFVTFDGRPVNVRLGWAGALREQGIDTTVTVLRLAEVRDAELARELGEASDHFLLVDRLRSIAGGPPISREHSRIPATERVLESITEHTAVGSLTRLLREAGLVAASGRQWVEARPLPAVDASVLGRAPGQAFLWSRCLTRTSSGAPVESVESYLDPAHFSLQFEYSATD